MKKISIILICLLAIQKTNAQENVITTGVPFLLVAADARSAGLGDQGVATSTDAYSQQWNPAKYAFIKKQMGFSASYTPYLTSLVNDISLGQVTFFNRIDDRSAFAVGLRYFSLGDIELRKDYNDPAVVVTPNEFILEGTYTLKIADKFSMGVSPKYIRSSLKIPDENLDTSSASTFAVDVSGYWQGEETAYNDFNGRLRFGFNFQNLGPKIIYDKARANDLSGNFLPANLKLGAGYDFGIDQYNKISVSAEFAKLLVPTPQNNDLNGDGTITATEISQNNENYQSIGWTSGIFKSFNDAPGGMSEELKEITYSLGAEYNYQDSFALRLGYFKEHQDKGARNFYSLGAGFKYTTVKIDVSYLFNASNIKSPLENTLRFSLSFDFGDDYDDN